MQVLVFNFIIVLSIFFLLYIKSMANLHREHFHGPWLWDRMEIKGTHNDTEIDVIFKKLDEIEKQSVEIVEKIM